MSSLSETLESVRAKIAKYRDKNLSEANTKTALIDPVLCALGWPVGNLDEVSLEFRLKSSDNPVDYALFLLGSTIPILLVEAKALGQSLDKWANQIMGYAGTCGVAWVVLTDGDEYRIYNASVLAPFEQKLFRTVRLSESNTRTEETVEILALLSKGRISDLDAQWKIHFADSQVQAALKKLFSPTPEFLPVLVSFVEKHVKSLTREDIKSSLARLRASFEFPNRLDEQRQSAGDRDSDEGGGYVDFWKPIRTESNGLFAGKPARKPGIGRVVRPRFHLVLEVHHHECYVKLASEGENRRERLDKALNLFPAANYPHEPPHESPKWASVRFRVLDKGIKDRAQWPQIREKLTQLGAEIYDKLRNSDV